MITALDLISCQIFIKSLNLCKIKSINFIPSVFGKVSVSCGLVTVGSGNQSEEAIKRSMKNQWICILFLTSNIQIFGICNPINDSNSKKIKTQNDNFIPSIFLIKETKTLKIK